MPHDTSFHDYILDDILNFAPGIKSRAMFGGWGLYRDGLIFGLIAENELYFKADDTNRIDYENLPGSHPFVYSQGDHKPSTMSYWLVPETIFADEEKIAKLLEASLAASKRAKEKKTKKRA